MHRWFVCAAALAGQRCGNGFSAIESAEWMVWQFRPHGSLGGQTPWEVWQERQHLTPFGDEAEAQYDRTAERIRHPVYRLDLELMEREKKIGRGLT
jgi:hypothetical protein